jgi:hypothetical protein
MQYPIIAQPQYGFAPTFASGGLADAARAVQSRGRNNDTMLVHMTPNEVNSLQGLAMAHGGTLTINPDTGLPEADFLEAILPMIAGFALGPAGFALMSAPMAALTVGGLTGLATGDLGKGLMAGLGAFGGANIGGALSSTGTQALQGQAMTGEVASQVAADAAASAAAQANTLAGTQLATPIVGSQAGADAILAAAQNAPTGFSSVGAGAKDLFTSGGFDRFGTALSQQAGGGLGATASLAGVGMPIVNALQPTYDFPETTVESNYAGPYKPSERRVRYPGDERRRDDSSEFQYFDTVNPYPGFVTAASGGAVRYQEGGMVAVPDAPERMLNMPGMGYQTGTAPEFNYNFRPVEVYTPPPAPAAQGTTDQNMFGRMFGNLADKSLPNGDSEEMRTDTEGSGLSSIFSGIFRRGREKEESNYKDLSNYAYDAKTQRMVPTATQMAQGGLAGLNAFNKGGTPKGRFLQGAGDGTSDSIPATIGGSQPARLADGEFVIDARTVSEIGNGSSKAGAKKLYAMMERVHKERKKAKRGQDSNADRYLPA